MSYQENKPYVVSADSQGLLKNWANKNQLTIPEDEYFQGMLRDLESTLSRYFSRVDIIPEEFISQGLNGFIKNSSVPVVSLDRAYVNPQQINLAGFLDATRTVDSRLNSTGLGSRARKISLERQIGQLALQQKGKSMALADDVIFEGKTMLQLVQKFRSKGIPINTVYSGITIKDGKELIERNGVRVDSLIVYDHVIDEICERDFVVGSPYSGRSVVDGGGIVQGAPYLFPFGKPVEWASIPSDEAVNFSLFALSQSLLLWAKTEQLSRQSISTKKVAKPVFDLPESKSMSEAIAKVIKDFK